jgi:hypothetical protein
MPLSPDPRRPVRRSSALAVPALTAAGYGLTLAIFYPGIMTYDAKFVHEDIAKGVLGDWQSPVMTVLWGVIDPIAPGTGSMFLLIATSYWLGFALLAFALARQLSRLALWLPLLMSDPLVVFSTTLSPVDSTAQITGDINRPATLIRIQTTTRSKRSISWTDPDAVIYDVLRHFCSRAVEGKYSTAYLTKTFRFLTATRCPFTVFIAIFVGIEIVKG